MLEQLTDVSKIY